LLDSPVVDGVCVRQARAGDRPALEAMFARCTPGTVYRRFHGQLKSFPASYLTEALAGLPQHYALVACDGPHTVALASLRLDSLYSSGDPGTASASAELGILIEDSWQRRGLGRELLDRLVAHGDRAGIAVLCAQVLTEQDWIIGLLSRYGRCEAAFRHAVREVRLRRDTGYSYLR
jgi:GNAT superfamily N-acetyltransferase